MPSPLFSLVDVSFCPPQIEQQSKQRLHTYLDSKERQKVKHTTTCSCQQIRFSTALFVLSQSNTLQLINAAYVESPRVVPGGGNATLGSISMPPRDDQIQHHWNNNDCEAHTLQGTLARTANQRSTQTRRHELKIETI